ncbi:sialin-like [Ptychodera flava]|uniref:sialin-like n=1 Tax=Ptychodera flava TaxID=63121 RepID=UPI00396A8D27
MDRPEYGEKTDPLIKTGTNDVVLVDKQKGCLSCRQVLAFLGFLGFVNVYCLRVNLSVAMVAMANTANSNVNQSDECPSNVTSKQQEGDFDWDEKTQGIILGSFFYGYIVTQIPGGWLGSRFSAKKLFGFGVLCTSLLTLVTPIAAKTSFALLIAVRVVEGIGEGVTFPAMHALWGKWAPPYERSRLAAFTYAGAQFGTVVALPISGLLCDSKWGWPSVFYVFGISGCLWFIIWMILVYETPSSHPRISQEEREYIEKSLGEEINSKSLYVPWLSIASSIRVWAIVLSHVANNWGFYTLLTCLPTYMKQILKFDLSQNGFISAIPYLLLWLIQTIGGRFADFLRERQILSTTTTRKLMNSLGLLLPATFLISTGYVGCNKILAVVFLTLAVGSGGFCMSGFNVNHLDIAPRYSGVLMGITNMFATIPGFVGPAIVGQLTNNQQTRGQWRIVFFICAAVYLQGFVTFLICGTGEEQPWNNSDSSGRGKYKPLKTVESDSDVEHPEHIQYGSHSDSD